MASELSDQIRCPVCLNDLRDPVCLPCEHCYCRGCITKHMTQNSGNTRCPECRRPFTQDDIRVNRVFRNLVDAAKMHLREHQDLIDRVASPSTRISNLNQDFTQCCTYHNEKIKLFCVTDEKLMCVICKEEETHRGHSFKTLDAAFYDKKKKTTETLETLLGENVLVDLINAQAEEILKTMEKSKALSNQISAQFMTLHQFLDDKENEIKKQLKEEENRILNIMGVNMFTIEEIVSDKREKQGIIKSALEMNAPCEFLQVSNELFGHLDFNIVPDTLYLGPYENYLQFFVWKEMLRSIKMVPHHHTVEHQGNQSISISPSGLSIQPKKLTKIQKNKSGSFWLKTVSSFTTGEHYWELDVGKKVAWGVGVCGCESGKNVNDTVLCFSSDFGYQIHQTYNVGKSIVDLTPQPRKIGVYLDCGRNQVSFYNADKMIPIDTKVLSKPPPYSLCLSPGLYLDGKNSDPLTICWY
ncbi:Zinc-binding protein A33 [Bagarius yarrelli]|uniref:Zinc-binding protein A33 n=1 Tax=Bagarius yarrelli TaxID=175774 RepID=A0A556V1U3_BAGYA|nr:Zinc-binding protein A33 [Bagarius yarrelli]